MDLFFTGPARHCMDLKSESEFHWNKEEEPILVLTRREGTDFVLTLDSPVHLWYLRYLRTCDTCVPTCVTLTA